MAVHIYDAKKVKMSHSEVIGKLASKIEREIQMLRLNHVVKSGGIYIEKEELTFNSKPLFIK